MQTSTVLGLRVLNTNLDRVLVVSSTQLGLKASHEASGFLFKGGVPLAFQ